MSRHQFEKEVNLSHTQCAQQVVVYNLYDVLDDFLGIKLSCLKSIIGYHLCLGVHCENLVCPCTSESFVNGFQPNLLLGMFEGI